MDFMVTLDAGANCNVIRSVLSLNSETLQDVNGVCVEGAAGANERVKKKGVVNKLGSAYCDKRRFTNVSSERKAQMSPDLKAVEARDVDDIVKCLLSIFQ